MKDALSLMALALALGHLVGHLVGHPAPLSQRARGFSPFSLREKGGHEGNAYLKLLTING